MISSLKDSAQLKMYGKRERECCAPVMLNMCRSSECSVTQCISHAVQCYCWNAVWERGTAAETHVPWGSDITHQPAEQQNNNTTKRQFSMSKLPKILFLPLFCLHVWSRAQEEFYPALPDTGIQFKSSANRVCTTAVHCPPRRTTLWRASRDGFHFV